MDLFQLWAFAPGGTSPTILPRPLRVDAGMVLSDVSSMTITYPLSAPGHEILDGYCDIELRYWNGTTWVCPPQGRFAMMDRNVDPVGETTQPTRTYTAVSWSWLLSGVLQAQITGLDDRGNRQFLNRSPAEVVGILLAEATAAGFTDAMSFVNNATTGGWAPAYAPGKSAADILSESRDQGFCEWLIQPDGTGCGRALTVYNSVGVDRSTGDNPVTLRIGRDFQQTPSKVSGRDLAAAVVVAGDAGKYLLLDNPGADIPYGLLRTYVGASGLDQIAALQTVAQARLDAGRTVRVEHTRQIILAGAEWLPLRDYGLGDTILAPDENGALAPLRVRQITVTFDGTWGGNLVLGDRFTERTLAMDRKLRQLTAGSLWGSGTLPSVPGAGWSAEQEQLATETTTGGAPSAPTVTVRLGVATIAWDGANVPDNFDHVEVHVGAVLDFAPDDSTLVGTLAKAGSVLVADLDYNAVRWARLVSVMRAGTKSAPSTSVQFTVTPLVDTDMIGTIVNGANIVNGSVVASDKIIGNTITGSLIQGLAIQTGHLAANAVTADKADIGSLRTAILIANIISSQMLKTDALDFREATGMTLTSALLRTAAAGARLEISKTSAAGTPGISYTDGTSMSAHLRLAATGVQLRAFATSDQSGTPSNISLSPVALSVDIGAGQYRIFSFDGTIGRISTPGQMTLNSDSANVIISAGASGSVGITPSLTVSAIKTSTGPLTITPSVTMSGSLTVAGNLTVSTMTAGSGSANVYWNSSTQQFYTASSLGKLKIFKRQITVDYAILDLVPKTWIDRTLRKEIDGYDLRTAGFVAEEVEAVAADHPALEPLLIRHAVTRELEGLAYDRISAYLIPVIRDMDARLRKAGL